MRPTTEWPSGPAVVAARITLFVRVLGQEQRGVERAGDHGQAAALAQLGGEVVGSVAVVEGDGVAVVDQRRGPAGQALLDRGVRTLPARQGRGRAVNCCRGFDLGCARRAPGAGNLPYRAQFRSLRIVLGLAESLTTRSSTSTQPVCRRIARIAWRRR